ncbi:MAG: archaellin/type IV pilin N-terminal domain-containing protein [Nanoarchaeota archaeon]
MEKKHKNKRKEFNKKAVSDVITTVLLILIVLAAIGIVWAVVSSFLNQGTQSIGGTADCFSTQLSIESATNSSVAITNQTIVRIKRIAGEGNITSLKFLLDGADTAFTGTIPSIAETRTFTSGTLAANPVGKTIEIAAIVGTRTCNVADSAVVTKA